jgi:ferredoxin/predicted Fe-Mo cluster-binding NifX family protein
MPRRILAFATTDGSTFTASHFGDAEVYAIHAFDGETFHHLEDVSNSTGEAEAHGAVHKARSIIELLKERGVDVAVSRRFGPNIQRIRHSLLPVVTEAPDVAGAMSSIRLAWDQILLGCQASSQERGQIVLNTEAENKKGRSMTAKVLDEKCRGCALCVPACPVEAIVMKKDKAVIDETLCVGCGACVEVCPAEAIVLAE